jgi:hypothetical protein
MFVFLVFRTSKRETETSLADNDACVCGAGNAAQGATKKRLIIAALSDMLVNEPFLECRFPTYECSTIRPERFLNADLPG